MHHFQARDLQIPPLNYSICDNSNKFIHLKWNFQGCGEYKVTAGYITPPIGNRHGINGLLQMEINLIISLLGSA